MTVSYAANLTAVAILRNSQQTQIIFTFNHMIYYNHFALSYPPRLVLDVTDSNLHTSLRHLPLQGTPILSLRSAKHDARTLRIVLDLKSQVASQFKLKQGLMGNSVKLTLTLPSLPASAAVRPHVIKMTQSGKLRNIIVVIDPGHGGKDPGAAGKHAHEKNVVLAIARQLKELINQQPGMKAVLTRNGDYFITLRQRLAIARKDNADVFISIHADAFNNPNSHGSSVFALSQRGATSEAARWLAAKENFSELGGVNLKYLDDKDNLVRSVLIDLSQTATIGASLNLGAKVLTNLNGMTQLHNARVEQARFVVLKSPDIPSILIETGFISNVAEEQRLVNPSYRKQLAAAILQGINGYFRMNPPPGTYWEAQKNSNNKVTRR